MKRSSVAFIFLVTLIAGAAWADTLKLAKGDALSGRLIKLQDGIVHFRAQLAGNMMVPADEVEKLTTSGGMVVNKTDGGRLVGNITLDAKSVKVAQDRGEAVTVSLESVASIEPSAQETKPEKINARLETGVLHRSGADEYTDAFARLKLSSELDTYLFDSELFVERADWDDFPRWLGAHVEWRFQPERLWHPTLGIGFERDTDKGLFSRTELQLGFTRSFLNDDLDFIAGVEGEATRWSPEVEDRFSLDLNMRVGLRYTRQIFETGSLTHSVLFTPSLTDSGRYRASAESALAFPFADRLKLRLNLLFDYEDYPQLDDLPKWRTTVGAGLFWDF